jgi:hypothetical protein
MGLLFLVPLFRNGANFSLRFLRTANIRRAPKMQLALRLEFLEIRTGRYIPESWRTATVHSNADNPKNPNLLLFWISDTTPVQNMLVWILGAEAKAACPREGDGGSEAVADAAAATTAGKAGSAGAFVAEASLRRVPRAQRRRRPRRVSYRRTEISRFELSDLNENEVK